MFKLYSIRMAYRTRMTIKHLLETKAKMATYHRVSLSDDYKLAFRVPNAKHSCDTIQKAMVKVIMQRN
jgi:hypothetical protein